MISKIELHTDAIGRLWSCQGIATQLARVVMAWGIHAFGLTRIWVSTDARHFKSQRVLEKPGMKRESLQPRHHQWRYREWVDEVVYGLDLTTATA